MAALTLSGSNDQLHLYTGSGVTGSISGGGRTDVLTLNGSGNGTLASAISNFETLTKEDAGTWTLAGPIGSSTPLAVSMQGGALVLIGANTYAGGTTLSGGTLTLGNNSALGTGPLSMAAGTSLSFLNTGTFVVGNNISIAGDPNFAPPGGTTQIRLWVASASRHGPAPSLAGGSVPQSTVIRCVRQRNRTAGRAAYASPGN